jgi:hypothetical protein
MAEQAKSRLAPQQQPAWLRYTRRAMPHHGFFAIALVALTLAPALGASGTTLPVGF